MDWLSIKEFFKDSVKYILAIILILFVITYVFSATQVVGNSMYPTLNDGDILIVNKFKYRFAKINRGDIISLKYADTKYLIKRVIGLPGEDIRITDNKLYINNQLYKEEYLPNNLNYNDFKLSDLGYTAIPKDMYLVLGDNRENSLDSRKIGLIKKSEINGKISFRFWPVNKMKFY